MSNGKSLPGQLFDPEFGVVTPFTEQMVDETTRATHDGDNNKEITPHDANSWLVRTYTPPSSALNTFSVSAPSTVNLNLPPVLVSLTSTFSLALANGDAFEDGDAFSGGESINLSLAISVAGQSSAAILPDVTPILREVWSQNVPVMTYLFFMANGSTTEQILARLSTLVGSSVLQWPVFRPVSHVIVMKGMKISLQATANIQQHSFLSNNQLTYSKTRGGGVARDISLTTRIMTIPPTIHEQIFVTAFQQATINATAQAHFNQGTPAQIWPALDSSVSAGPYQISGSVLPSIFPATTPSVIPTSGKYLYRLDSEPYRWGYSRVRAEVIDFQNFAG